MTTLYYDITAASPDDREPRNMFKRFEQLKATAKGDLQAQFKSAVSRLADGHWEFAFKIGDTEIYRSDRLRNGPGQYHSEFAQYPKVPVLAGAVDSVA
jgi:hypothetical protein